jgi:hypothetical protein
MIVDPRSQLAIFIDVGFHFLSSIMDLGVRKLRGALKKNKKKNKKKTAPHSTA